MTNHPRRNGAISMDQFNRFNCELDAVMTAKAAARVNGQGYAYAVEWFDHWSVEPRKPSFRGTKNGRPTKVIECRNNGEILHG